MKKDLFKEREEKKRRHIKKKTMTDTMRTCSPEMKGLRATTLALLCQICMYMLWHYVFFIKVVALPSRKLQTFGLALPGTTLQKVVLQQVALPRHYAQNCALAKHLLVLAQSISAVPTKTIRTEGKNSRI